jgi:excisionase family DNA binding protein
MTTDRTMDRLLRVEEAAERTGLRVATIRQKILRREWEVVRLGRAVRLKESMIQKLISENTIPARADGK